MSEAENPRPEAPCPEDGIERLRVTPESRPKLPRHVMLRHDKTRDRWLILAPERVLAPEPTAVELLRLADGKRSLREIAEELAAIYAAPTEVIEADALEMFQDLADRGFLTLAREARDG